MAVAGIDVRVLAIVFFVAVALVFFSSVFNLNVVRGDSMAPTWGLCTLVVSDKHFLPSEVVSRDVVVIDISDSGLEFPSIVHRVVENNVGEEWISTRGDNDAYYEFPSSIDGFFEYSRFRGKVVWFVGCG